jgi:hypothetical protein
MSLNINDENNFKVHESSELKIYSSITDYLLIDDIKNDQLSTIGQLHYDLILPNPNMRTIFTTDGSDKVVRNGLIGANNRINYNIGSIPSKFTAIFDYKAGGGVGGDGAYFYFYAKGTKNPNTGEQCSYYDFENDQQIFYACDSFPVGRYSNGLDTNVYIVHLDEFHTNQQLAVSWNGYEPFNNGLLDTVGPVEQLPLGFNLADSTWRKIKINFNNGNFKIYIDNDLKIDFTDIDFGTRDLSGSNLGLGGYVGELNNYHYFKNFKFYSILI